jgi:hypothetical protein
MNFIELTQPPQAEGQPIVKLKAIIDQIAFTFKKPFEPTFVVVIADAKLPCIGQYEDVLNGLAAEGFTIFDTPEGTHAAVNSDRVTFFTSPELGIYSLVFLGKAALTVRATTNEVEGMFNKSPIIGT